jgi:segregation and condensation protein B
MTLNIQKNKKDIEIIAINGTPVESDHIRAIEAILFAANTPLSLEMIRDRIQHNVAVPLPVRDIVLYLRDFYKNRGFILWESDGFWSFRTHADMTPFLSMDKTFDKKLSKAALETMAIIAYHQPLTRADIETIRGVAVHKGTLDVLMECGWIKPGRRRETAGRPLTWVTTNDFLVHFGLENLNDLPRLDDLKSAGLLDRRPAIENTLAGGIENGLLFDQQNEPDESE